MAVLTGGRAPSLRPRRPHRRLRSAVRHGGSLTACAHLLHVARVRTGLDPVPVRGPRAGTPALTGVLIISAELRIYAEGSVRSVPSV